MSIAKKGVGAGALAAITLGLCSPANALIINPGQTGRYDYSFSSSAPGPFQIVYLEVVGKSIPNTFFTYNLQVYDPSNTLLMSYNVLNMAFSQGDFGGGGGQELPVSTTTKQGHVIITDLSQTIDVSLLRIGYGAFFGAGTEVIDLSPGFEIVDYVPSLPDFRGDGYPGPSVPEPSPLSIFLAALTAIGLLPASKWLKRVVRLSTP